MDELPRIVREYKPDEVLIAIPSASGEVRARVVEAAQAADVPVKTLPGLYELISGDVNLAGQIRPVQVEDVLGREQVEVDFEQVAVVPRGADGARHRRGRLDRRRALPPDRARRARAADPRRQRRDRRSSRSSASSSTSATSRPRSRSSST